ncbi:unnamed protein product [Didymodactylos carnosus]|uniref:Uncharacterized protein n=1 Tax=Didymodactylos carnosus TaxID=1234261 RepID=A0A814BRE4_9BILA|nr:unnamed protein product [Didymodactylos carnosus]CAF0930178.1 unnamed protein product [Didymodactylos carnosus]CAF3548504.1 unnamed protein product [Didymodactylos carnosus]CAF3708242.1 unnamed protein product [Didymodactylos carnosus]
MLRRKFVEKPLLINLPPFVNAALAETYSLPDKRYFKTSFCYTKKFTQSPQPIEINDEVLDYYQIEGADFSNRIWSGHWWPKKCQAETRLAVIISYHNNSFNHAILSNIGYIESTKLYNYTCFIFHDVDLLPEDDRNLYTCGDKPRHLSVAIDKFNYELWWPGLFGGVTAFRRQDFINVNGFATIYQGWGGEDDDMYSRVMNRLKNITRPPMDVGRYKMIRNRGHVAGDPNPHRHEILKSNYSYSLDGLNTTEYQLNEIKFYKLFVLINVTLTQLTWDQIKQRINLH